MDADKKETIIQTFHPSFSELYISQTIDVSCFLFQSESEKKLSHTILCKKSIQLRKV